MLLKILSDPKLKKQKKKTIKIWGYNDDDERVEGMKDKS